MSAPSPSWRAAIARWLSRGAAAVAGAAFDAAVDSLELGKRAAAWVAHAPAARLAVVAALALAVAGGAAWAARYAHSPRATVTGESSTQRDGPIPRRSRRSARSCRSPTPPSSCRRARGR